MAGKVLVSETHVQEEDLPSFHHTFMCALCPYGQNPVIGKRSSGFAFIPHLSVFGKVRFSVDFFLPHKKLSVAPQASPSQFLIESEEYLEVRKKTSRNFSSDCFLSVATSSIF